MNGYELIEHLDARRKRLSRLGYILLILPVGFTLFALTFPLSVLNIIFVRLVVLVMVPSIVCSILSSYYEGKLLRLLLRRAREEAKKT